MVRAVGYAVPVRTHATRYRPPSVEEGADDETDDVCFCDFGKAEARPSSRKRSPAVLNRGVFNLSSSAPVLQSRASTALPVVRGAWLTRVHGAKFSDTAKQVVRLNMRLQSVRAQLPSASQTEELWRVMTSWISTKAAKQDRPSRSETVELLIASLTALWNSLVPEPSEPRGFFNLSTAPDWLKLSLGRERKEMPEPRTFVDLACGDGNVVLDVCSALPACYGIGSDVSASFIECANATAKRRGLDSRCQFHIRSEVDVDLTVASFVFLQLPTVALGFMQRRVLPRSGLQQGAIIFCMDEPLPEASCAFERVSPRELEEYGLFCYVCQETQPRKLPEAPIVPTPDGGMRARPQTTPDGPMSVRSQPQTQQRLHHAHQLRPASQPFRTPSPQAEHVSVPTLSTDGSLPRLPPACSDDTHLDISFPLRSAEDSLPSVAIAGCDDIHLAKSEHSSHAKRCDSFSVGTVVKARRDFLTVHRGERGKVQCINDERTLQVQFESGGPPVTVHEKHLANLTVLVVTHEVELIDDLGQGTRVFMPCVPQKDYGDGFCELLCQDGRTGKQVHMAFVRKLPRESRVEINLAVASPVPEATACNHLPPAGYLKTKIKGVFPTKFAEMIAMEKEEGKSDCHRKKDRESILEFVSTLDGPNSGSSLCPFMEIQEGGLNCFLAVCNLTCHDTVFDLGCGNGKILLRLLQFFPCSGVGVELNPALARHAEQDMHRFAGRARILVDDVRNVDLRSATVVTCFFLSHSFESDGASLKEHLSKTLCRGCVVLNYTYPVPGWSGEYVNGVYRYTIGKHLQPQTSCDTTDGPVANRPCPRTSPATEPRR